MGKPIKLVFHASVFFFLLLSLGHDAVAGMAQLNRVPVPVGVVLDLNSSMGSRSLTSVSMAVDDFYDAHPNYRTRVVLHERDSEDDVIGAASAALDLLKNVQVQAIIGPPTSAQAQFVVDLGNKTQVPVLSFSATSPSLSPSRTPYFVRTALNDSSQVGAIADITQHYGWREVVPVYEDTDYGTGVIPSLVDAFQKVDAKVPYRSVIPPDPTDDQISKELYKLMTMQTRVFVVHMMPDLAVRLFQKAAQVGMLSQGYIWITTDGIGNVIDLLDPTILAGSMQGVLGVRSYVPRSKELLNFTAQWKARFRRDHPGSEAGDPSIMQLWAYDTAWALAMAVETAKAGWPDFKNPNGVDNSTDLTRLGISQTGPKLRAAISNTRFKGISGEFQLVNRQLQQSSFEIVNVVGKGGRTIGYWNPVAGISRELKSTTGQSSLASAVNLKPVIWPGELTQVPKGWEIPTNGKILRVAVPVKNGFHEFVTVDQDPITNRTRVTGYCIDVFEAVVQALPYALSYEYIPYGNPDMSYDEIVYQVFLQNFDAVVGDVTIVANRSSYVDFTLPYTESGVSMIVPNKHDQSKNMWIFLQPLTTDLWLGSLAFFFFTGFVVWMIEHRINDEFRGPPSQQLGIIFYFSFSTLVYAHREKLESNLSRFAVIIWVFVVLILTSSYTASLTSMLTVQQLQPTVTDVNELLKNRDYVGYQDGSFVHGLLKQRMTFGEDRIKSYSTPDEYAEALSKGSGNGGVAAIFDEIPYLKLFLSEYCANYTMVGPTYKTDGFGFVFPRGSPLVPDISRAILNVTEGDQMTQIEKKWFGEQTTCPSESSEVGSSSLNFQSFGGLFLITGVVSFVALLIFTAMFIYQNWSELKTAASVTSLWRRIVAWARHYDRKDLTSPTFKKEAAKVVNDEASNRNRQPLGARMNTDGSQSPISISDLSDFNFGTPEEGRPSTELGDPFTERPPEAANACIERTEIRDGN